MKNTKHKTCLADFENELENLNHSEMKEVVGGDYGYVSGGGSGGVMTFTCVATPNSGGNFGGYNSYSAFLSSYPSSPVITSGGYSGGGGSSTTPSTKATECVKAYDASVAVNDFVLRQQAVGAAGSLASGNPLAIATAYGLVATNYLINNYYSSMNLASCLR